MLLYLVPPPIYESVYDCRVHVSTEPDARWRLKATINKADFANKARHRWWETSAVHYTFISLVLIYFNIPIINMHIPPRLTITMYLKFEFYIYATFFTLSFFQNDFYLMC